MTFWEIIWFIIVSFAFIAYLMVLFNIIADLFRDHVLSGGWKAVWIVFLVLVPLITALVYLIARGQGMADRQLKAIDEAVARQDAYIQQVAGATGGQSPADQIAGAKALLDAGTISQAEFEALKAKALA